MEAIKYAYKNKGFDGGVHHPIVKATGEQLSGAVDTGFGVLKNVDFDSPDFVMREYLKRNIWKFSVAKNYNDCIKLSNLLVKEDGSLRSWNEFKREAERVVGDSNRYLKTEYDTIVASAQMSRLWQEIQRDKHIFPYVQLDVILDKRTSDICEPLAGLIFEVDDPVLAYYFPPNHFNCRTTVRKLRTGTPSKNYELPDIPDEFKNNSGISGQIFTDKNRYIENTPQDLLKESDEFAKRWERYSQYLNNSSYKDVKLGDNFGLKATHKDHNFDAKTGRYEAEARDNIFKAGHEIIMLSEKAPDGVKTPDGLLNGKIVDIKTVLGEGGKLGKNNIINKMRDANRQGCEIIVVQFPKPSVPFYQNTNMETEIRSAKKLLIKSGKEIKIKEVWVIVDAEIIKFSF